MAQCDALKAQGGRCKNLAATGSAYCPAHDPARAEARKRAASKGGRSKGGGAELKELKKEVRSVIGGVLSGRLEKGSASVALQGFNVLIRATEQERRLLETQELERRLEELEEAIEHNETHNGRGRRVGLRRRLRRVEREAEADMIVLPQLDGSVKRFPHNVLLEAMVRGWERGRVFEDGELDTAPPTHPFTEALLSAPEGAVDALLERESWGFGYIITEEQVCRGLIARPGPGVVWSEDGTTCRSEQ